jgi:hypothetical protein
VDVACGTKIEEVLVLEPAPDELVLLLKGATLTTPAAKVLEEVDVAVDVTV